MKIFLALILLANVAYADIQTAFSPNQGGTELVIKTIQEAKQSIDVAAYSFTSAPIAKALTDAHKKGIKVRVVLDKSQRTARYTSYTFLKNHNVPTRINIKYAIMHNKFMIIDGNILQLGSFNYTKAAEYKNAENVMVISNEPDAVKQYQLQWLKLWNESAVE